MKSKKVECKICKRHVIRLGKHVKMTHKIEPSEYYDKYLSTPENNKHCVFCGTPGCFFDGISNGYYITCSKTCSNKLRNDKLGITMKGLPSFDHYESMINEKNPDVKIEDVNGVLYIYCCGNNCNEKFVPNGEQLNRVITNGQYVYCVDNNCGTGNRYIKLSKLYSRHNKDGNLSFKYYSPKIEKYEKVDNDGKDGLRVYCTNCKKLFYPDRSSINERIKGINGNDTGRFYCSNGCKGSCSIFGRTWTPKGFKPESYRETIPDWLRKEVINKTNGLCSICDDDGVDIHHIISVAEAPTQQLDKNNMELLCEDCHKEKHRENGFTLYDLKLKKAKCKPV